MKAVLVWIIPPLVGAVIGYVTNAIAIKMLFRPLNEKRFFGIKLPFTPGILPRERGKLAASIGRMVEQELITPGVLRDRLAKNDVQVKIETAVANYTGQMAERPLSQLLEEKPGDFPIMPLVKNFINSEIFDSLLESIITIWLRGGELSSEGKRNSASWVKSRMRDFGSLFVPAAKNLIRIGIDRDLKNQVDGEISVYRMAMDTILEKYPGITLREFLSLGKQQKLEIDSFMAVKTVSTLNDNIDEALSSVDIKKLVSDRIDTLEMVRVEKIILDIMAGQLKWINFFGAILGALIGFIQVLINIFIK